MNLRWLLGDAAGVASYSAGPFLLSKLSREQFVSLTRWFGYLRALNKSPDQLAELKLLFPDRTKQFYRSTIQESIKLRVLNELEVLRYPNLTSANIDSVCEIHGLQHVDEALSHGKGAILMIGHFGANQLIMPALGYRDYAIHQLSAPPTVWADILPERANPMWRKKLASRWALEQSLPVQHINVFKFLRPAFSCLKANEVLGLAFDGGGGKEWLSVDFLGRKMTISTQPFQLWQKTRTKLLPTVVLRPSWQSVHQVMISPELVWEDAEDPIQHNAQRYVDCFSGWVQQFPCHYLPFLQMRRQVRITDVHPFFDDYPSHPDALGVEAALERLREAGQQT